MSIFDQLREAIAATLNISPETVTPESSADSLDAWDSLGQVNLMMTLEQTFDLMLDVEDFQRLNSVPAIIEYLEENGVAG
jgi:acyl carrier protein